MENASTLYDSGFFGSQVEGSIASARHAVPVVMELVKPRSVVDVGCGLGAWLLVFKELGVPCVLGLDGEYVERSQLLIDETEFRQCDLSQPFVVEGTYELAVALEVAEHLPETSASCFVKSLTRLAPVVLFSAAVPGQGGTGHCNEQWPWYWRGLFDANGYTMIDAVRPTIWGCGSIEWFYRQNLVLFVRKELVGTGRFAVTLTSDTPSEELLVISRGVLESNLALRPSLRRVLSLVRQKLTIPR